MDSTFSEQDMLLVHQPSCLTHAFYNLKTSTLSIYKRQELYKLEDNEDNEDYEERTIFLTPYPLYLRVDDIRIELTREGAEEQVEELLSHKKWFRAKKVDILRLENEKGHIDLKVLLVPGDLWDIESVDHLTLYHTIPAEEIDISDLVYIVKVNEFYRYTYRFKDLEDNGRSVEYQFQESLEYLFTRKLRPLGEYFQLLCEKELESLKYLSYKNPSAVFSITLSKGEISLLVKEY